MGISLYDYCHQNGRTDLLEQWHPKKNGNVDPTLVPPLTRIKVWWKCSKGHEWEAQIMARVQGTGCPICSNRTIVPGVNDLASTHPELAVQWHPQKNLLSPKQISYGSKKNAWWICEKGHEWEARVLSRSYGAGCPVCTGKTVVPGDNDLATRFPALASEWHPKKNCDLHPEDVTPFSNRKVWWRCEKGHEWQAYISHRARVSTGCPYCANKKVLPGFNDLATVHPIIAAQWHPTLNEGLTPEMIVSGSSKKVWWQCSEGHVWKAVVYSRTGTDKCGCPVCAGKVSEKKQQRYASISETKHFRQLACDETEIPLISV